MFLNDLIQRTLGETPAIAPRRASRFEAAAEPLESAVEVEAPAPRPEAPPPTGMPDAPPPLFERRETRIVERLRMPAPQDPVRIVPEQRAVPPAPEQTATPDRSVAASPADTAIAAPDSPRDAGAAAVPVSAKLSEPARAATMHSLETRTREIHETRVEVETIEQRLESLVRERTVERVEQIGTRLVMPSREPLPSTPRAAREAERRQIIEPGMRLARPTLRPPMEMPGPEPSTEVHITIGRVEVKAAAPVPPRQPARSREPRPLKTGLEDYLERRERS